MFQDKRYKNREHLIIQELNHPCVIKLKEAFFTQGDKVIIFINKYKKKTFVFVFVF